jgi:hypothetical protein
MLIAVNRGQCPFDCVIAPGARQGTRTMNSRGLIVAAGRWVVWLELERAVAGEIQWWGFWTRNLVGGAPPKC